MEKYHSSEFENENDQALIKIAHQLKLSKKEAFQAYYYALSEYNNRINDVLDNTDNIDEILTFSSLLRQYINKKNYPINRISEIIDQSLMPEDIERKFEIITIYLSLSKEDLDFLQHENNTSFLLFIESQNEPLYTGNRSEFRNNKFFLHTLYNQIITNIYEEFDLFLESEGLHNTLSLRSQEIIFKDFLEGLKANPFSMKIKKNIDF